MLKNLICLLALCLSTTAFARALPYVGQTSPHDGHVYYHVCQDRDSATPLAHLPCSACGLTAQSSNSIYQCRQAAPTGGPKGGILTVNPKPIVTPKATPTLTPKPTPVISEVSKGTISSDEAFYTTVRIESAPAGTERDYPRVMFLMENGKCWKYRWVADRANPSWQLSGLADYCGSCGRQYSEDNVEHGQCVPNQTGKSFLPE